MARRLGRHLIPENITTILCEDQRLGLIENVTLFFSFFFLERNIEQETEVRRELFLTMIKNILTEKEEDEQRRQQENRAAAAAIRRGTTRRGKGVCRTAPTMRGSTNRRHPHGNRVDD